jgi:hypothetical protein
MLLPGIKVSTIYNDKCNACGLCALKAGDPVNRHKVVFDRTDNGRSFCFERCSRDSDAAPPDAEIAAHLAFLLACPQDGDPDRMWDALTAAGFGPEGAVVGSPLQMLAMVELVKDLRAFLISAEVEQIAYRAA